MSIQEWLDGPQDYAAGLLLYQHLGSNPQLKRTLGHGPNAYNTSCLREELVRLDKQGQGQVVVQLVPVATTAAVVQLVPTAQPAPAAAAAVTSVMEQLLADLDKQWKPLYKEASFLQSQLEHAKDNQERGTWSHKILDLMDEVAVLWEACAHVQEHGELPPVPVVTPPAALDLTDRDAVEQHRNNLRSQISKQKRNAKRAAEVEAWRAEVQQLSELLKTLP
ncbi:MAG: hypothetical protein ACRYFZ_19415 [Janthinobacterium lividum]